MQPVQLQPAFILHTRPYKDTSLLVDILSQDYGRVSLVAKGQRGTRKKSNTQIYPFAEFLLSWQGKGELKNLTVSDCVKQFFLPPGWLQFSGIYINELLIRLMPQQDEHRDLFHYYRECMLELARLSENEIDRLEALLRQFELNLLESLGYGISFFEEGSGRELDVLATYRYVSDKGFISVRSQEGPNYFAGKNLVLMSAGDFSEKETLRDAKRLLRLALAPHLGGKPLRSRELFGRAR